MRYLRTVMPPLRRAAWWSDSRPGLACLFAAGLALRLGLAPHGGLPFDLYTFRAWAQRLAHTGAAGFYRQGFLADYPPGYLYVLWGLGKLSGRGAGAAPSFFLLKLPGIVADLGLACAAVILADRLTPPRLASGFPCRGVAAVAVLFNPAIIFVSAVWGQIDSLLALLVLLAFLFFGTGRPTLRREVIGAAILGLALGTKTQAIFVVPIVVIMLVWRHTSARATPEPAENWGRVLAPLARLALLGSVTVGVVLALFAPFGEGPLGVVEFYRGVTGTYQFTSLFAFNLWGVVAFYRPDIQGPNAVGVFSIGAAYIGSGAFVIGCVWLCFRAWHSLHRVPAEGIVVLFGGAAVTALAFTVLTRVHERYLYLALACLAPLVGSPTLRRFLAGLSLLFFLNIYFAYVYYVRGSNGHPPEIKSLYVLLYGDVTNSFQTKVLSAVTAIACLLLAGWGWRHAERLALDRGPVAGPQGGAVGPGSSP